MGLLRSGRGGGPHAGTNREDFGVFFFSPPNGRLTPTVPEGGPSIMAPTRPNPLLHSDNFVKDPATTTVTVPTPKFLCVKLTSENATMKSISPFYIQRALDFIAGKVKNATRSRDGSLIVETNSPAQSDKLLKATLFGSHPIIVERHKSLNTCRGVVSTDGLDGLDNEEIQLELADQCVSQAYRLTKRSDGDIVPLRTVFLTFERPSLPEYIRVGYERVPVRPYVPNPMRCFRCQRFGHTQVRCTSDLVRVHCGDRSHGDDACTRPVMCVNCGGKHSSNDRQCPRYIHEKRIQEIRVQDGISFVEARKKLDASLTAKGPTSYAAVAKVRTAGVTVACQTPPPLPVQRSAGCQTDVVSVSVQTDGSYDENGLFIRSYTAAAPASSSSLDDRSSRRSSHRGRSLSRTHSRSRSRSVDKRKASVSPPASPASPRKFDKTAPGTSKKKNKKTRSPISFQK